MRVTVSRALATVRSSDGVSVERGRLVTSGLAAVLAAKLGRGAPNPSSMPARLEVVGNLAKRPPRRYAKPD